MRSIRWYAALIALPLVVSAAACTSTPTPSPAPTTPPAATVASPSPSSSSSLSPPPSLSPSPSLAPSPSPSGAPVATTPVPAKKDTCRGAVTYVFDPRKSGSWPRPCIEVGAVVRITPHGPWDFGVSPAGRVDCFYEGGTHECRLIGTGTVAFTMSSGRVLKVDIVKATSPRRPSTECQRSGTYVLDASYGGPPWEAICLRRSVTLRIEHHGPEGVTYTPAGLTSCYYEAAVRVCKLVRAGTLRLSIVNEHETRILHIVIAA